MEFMIKGVRVRISFLFVSLTALYILLAPAVWPAFFLLAVAAHETAHLIVLFAFGEPPASIELRSFGIKIARRGEMLSTRRELVALASGPLANLTLSALFFLVSHLSGLTPLLAAARINLLVAAFNLFPAGHLDGGNILRCLLELSLPPNSARRAYFVAAWLFLLPLAVLGAVLLAAPPHSPSLLLTSAYLAFTLLRDLSR